MNATTRGVWVLAALLAVGAASSSAQADEKPSKAEIPAERFDDAKEHFRVGVVFFKEQNFRAAQIEFQAAYDTWPSYKLRYNLAQTCIELHEYVEAIALLERYLIEGEPELSRERRAQVDELIRSLRTRTATVSLVTNVPTAEIRVNGVQRGSAGANQELQLSAGRHWFTADAPGRRRAESVVDLAAGEHRVVRLELPPGLDTAQPSSLDRDTWRLGAGALWTGVAALTLGAAGLTMSFVTLSAEREYKQARVRLEAPATLTELRRDERTKARITDVFYLSAIAAAGVAVVLFLTDQEGGEPRPEASRVSLRLGSATQAIGVHATF